MKKGFTLIELLVVITILAVLAGAALPYVQSYVEESRVAKAKTDLEEIARALAVYETREGDYSKGSVEDLTGRYLNKAPIDPWGSQYKIDVNSGTVYSTGPDRSDTGNGIYDNIIVPYQPPMALVSAKWVDKNQSGAVDTQNVRDELLLTFSRKLPASVNAGTMNTFATKMNLVLAAGTTSFLSSSVVTNATPILVGDKTIVYQVLTNSAFVPGADAVEVQNSHDTIVDRTVATSNFCLSGQAVKILPQ